MKKQLLTVLFALMLSTSAYAGSIGAGVQLGIGFVEADGSETEVGTGTKTLSDGEVTNGSASHDGVPIISAYVEYNSDYMEKGEANSLTIGASLVPFGADVSDKTKSRTDASTGAAVTTEADTGDRNANAELENLQVIYTEIPVSGGYYGRIGMAQVDVITTESFTNSQGTAPSSYGNKTVDGYNFGFGYKGMTSAGLHYKISYQYTDFNDFNITSGSGNIVSADIDMQELLFSAGFKF